jgi:intron-binding protein aquarius
LYRQLVDLFHFYQYFPIDDHTGQPVSDTEMVALQYSRLTQLQRLFFKYHPALRELALSNCGTLQKRSVLKPALQGLDFAELQKLVVKQLR